MSTTALIAVRNAQAHIVECLDSLGDFDQVLVRDDCSSDRTAAIAHAFGHSVTINPTHLGQSETKRQLAQDCDTPHCCFVDADDVRLAGTLPRQVGTLVDGVGVAIAPALVLGTVSEISCVANPYFAAWFGHPAIAICWDTSMLKKLLRRPLLEGAPEQQLMLRAIKAGVHFAFTGRPVAAYRRDWSPVQASKASKPVVAILRKELLAIAPATVREQLERLEARP
ncbi:MAG: glycosyltransferase [Chloroflexaceae bacterium]|nr:glycosyltransferase [Chloroflexaceae bacterium]